MALERLAANELAGTGNAEALLGALWDFILGMKLSFIASLNLLLVALSCLLIEGSLDGGEQHEHISTFQLRADSTVAYGFKSSARRSSTFRPCSGCAISRPRNMMVIFTPSALFQEAQNVALLGLVIAHVDLGTELHLLDLNARLVLTSRLGFHGLLVLVLTIVHDPADRRIRIGRNLDEVETLLISDTLRIADAEEAQLGAVDTNQATPGRGDLVVDTRVIVLSYFSYLPQMK